MAGGGRLSEGTVRVEGDIDLLPAHSGLRLHRRRMGVDRELGGLSGEVDDAMRPGLEVARRQSERKCLCRLRTGDVGGEM